MALHGIRTRRFVKDVAAERSTASHRTSCALAARSDDPVTLRGRPFHDSWPVVFGSNLGGNVTPIGSASTVLACTILKRNDR